MFSEPIYMPRVLNTGTCIQQGDLFYSAGLHRNHVLVKPNTGKNRERFWKKCRRMDRKCRNKQERKKALADWSSCLACRRLWQGRFFSRSSWISFSASSNQSWCFLVKRPTTSAVISCGMVLQLSHNEIFPSTWLEDCFSPQPTQGKIGRGFGKNAGEWTGSVEISKKERNPWQ